MKHFKPSEFMAYEKISAELLFLIDDIREASGYKIRINSDWRPNGSGYHPIGLALDFCWPEQKINSLEQYCLLREFRQIGGLGYYPDWHTPGWHIDLRSGFAQWVRLDGDYFYGWHAMARAIGVL